MRRTMLRSPAFARDQRSGEPPRQSLLAEGQDFQVPILRFKDFPFLPEPFRGRSQAGGFGGLQLLCEERQLRLLGLRSALAP